MWRLFEINPSGVLETMYATYCGLKEFAEKHGETGNVSRVIGDYGQAVAYRYICNCNKGV